MATGTWETINDALVTLLNLLKGDGLRIAVVSNWPNPSPGSYPHAFPLPQRPNEFDYDTQSNNRNVQFILRVEFPEPATQEAHLDMLKTADALDNEVRKRAHITLGGIVHSFKVMPGGGFGRTGEGESEMIVYDVVVSAETLKDI